MPPDLFTHLLTKAQAVSLMRVLKTAWAQRWACVKMRAFPEGWISERTSVNANEDRLIDAFDADPLPSLLMPGSFRDPECNLVNVYGTLDGDDLHDIVEKGLVELVELEKNGVDLRAGGPVRIGRVLYWFVWLVTRQATRRPDIGVITAGLVDRRPPDRLLGLCQFLRRVPEPVGAPDAMDGPAILFQHLLPETVPVSGRARTVIGGAVALDAQEVPSWRLRGGPPSPDSNHYGTRTR